MKDVTITLPSSDPKEQVILLQAVYAVLAGAASAPVLDFSPEPKTAAPLHTPIPTPGVANAGPVDADGWHWTAELHSASKTLLKDGRWRMKNGVERPAPKTTQVEETEEVEEVEDATKVPQDSFSEAVKETMADEPADEFAAFAATQAEPEAVERTWTDADMSKLANQAAQALGAPDKVKDLIAQYCPEGALPRSTNIQGGQREAFAQALEALAGIKYAG